MNLQQRKQIQFVLFFRVEERVYHFVPLFLIRVNQTGEEFDELQKVEGDIVEVARWQNVDALAKDQRMLTKHLLEITQQTLLGNVIIR